MATNNAVNKTMPTGAVVGDTDTQTLTNKTIDGGSNTLTNIPASALATTAITLGYATNTAGFSTSSGSAVQVTGLSVTVTIPSGGRKVKITVWCTSLQSTTNGAGMQLSLWDGTVGTGTQLTLANSTGNSSSAFGNQISMMAVVTPAAGSKTYNVGLSTSSGTADIQSAAGYPAFILVEAI